MSRNVACLAAFPPRSEIEIASNNGQLLQTDEAPRPPEFGTKIRAIAVAEGELSRDSLCLPMVGVTFALASPDRCFDRMLLGLTTLSQQGDRNEGIDFCVCLEQDLYYSTVVTIKEPGAEAAVSRICDGDERVTIRLNGEIGQVQYLINDVLVHTSNKEVQFPLVCKVVNLLRRNLIPTHSYSLPSEWRMRLPVKKLEWTNSIVNALVLRVQHIGEDGAVSTAFINMAGEEVARSESVVGQTVADLKETLLGQIAGDISLLRLINEDGRHLLDTEEWPLLGLARVVPLGASL
jgi:hypothetical protein